jgi:hypothetical protein
MELIVVALGFFFLFGLRFGFRFGLAHQGKL